MSETSELGAQAGTQPSDRVRAEQKAMALVTARLRDRFPGVPAPEVDEVVAGYHHEYDGSRVRDYIPLLVEREAADHFSARIPEQRSR